ncbi:hypothetical protein [Vibrio splendidus]|uniref:hypothetical protein n=1 Tax=Vibrio splendidus TaxID=29497 RepID=UPI000769DF44|nr:hypothetical protein [Vibrio splendidus]PHX04340.1 hypothetical protein VSPL_41130 [Vibrio splendidus]
MQNQNLELNDLLGMIEEFFKSDISKSDLFVYYTLLKQKEEYNNNVSFTKYADIEHLFNGMKKTSFSRCLKKLKDAGFIDFERKTTESNETKITFFPLAPF